MMMTEKKIYFHVGLGKAASTYLQKSVFPHFREIHYLHRNRYKRHPQIVPGLAAKRVLLSRESSWRLATEAGKLASYYTGVVPIVVLRQHDDWIASQFRRYVKNGGAVDFSGFVDFEHDCGVWKQSELKMLDKLHLLHDIFDCKPYVIFYDQLRDEPYRVIDELATLIGASYDRDAIPLQPRHRSYTDKQLQVLRRYRPRCFEAHPSQPKKGVYGYLRFRLRLLSSYAIMALARFVADDGFAGEPLIPASALQQIRESYTDDWQACQDYAEKNNAIHLSEA